MHIILSLPLFSFIDPSLGKVDRSSLPEQTLMELFIEGITNTEAICDMGNGTSSDILFWKNVDRDPLEHVYDIRWDRFDLKGSIHLQWLPPNLEKLNLDTNFLSGSLDFTNLPSKLIELFLCENAFEGTISLEFLPESLECIDVSNNKLYGSVNLTKLPDAFEYLFVDVNAFSGKLDFTNLPPNILSLHLSDNMFEGEADFSKLPDSLTYVDIENTKLTGTIARKSGRDIHCSGTFVTVVDK